jgi:hypothetical protein
VGTFLSDEASNLLRHCSAPRLLSIQFVSRREEFYFNANESNLLIHKEQH